MDLQSNKTQIINDLNTEVVRCLTWDSLTVSKTHYLSIEDAASSAEGFEELRLLLIDNVFYHIRVFFQFRESFTLQDESEHTPRSEMQEGKGKE